MKITKWCQLVGLRPHALAVRAGLSAGAIYRYASGARRPEIPAALAIERASRELAREHGTTKAARSAAITVASWSEDT